MALNIVSLTSEIETEIKARIPAQNLSEGSDLTNFCEALATAIINHIQTNAEVSTDVSTTVTGTDSTGGAIDGTGTESGAPGTVS